MLPNNAPTQIIQIRYWHFSYIIIGYSLRATKFSYGLTNHRYAIHDTHSGVARPKLMVGPDYRGTKEVLENLPLAAPG